MMLALSYAGYVLGRESELEHILRFLESGEYQVRCAAIHALGQIITDKNSREIQKAIEPLAERDENRAVRENAKELLAQIGR